MDTLTLEHRCPHKRLYHNVIASREKKTPKLLPAWIALPTEKSTCRLKWLTRAAKFLPDWSGHFSYLTEPGSLQGHWDVTLYASTWFPPVCCCHKPNSIFKEILESRWGVWVKSQWALHSLSPPCSLTHNTCRKGCANLSPVRRGCNKETTKNNRRFHCSFKQHMARVILHHSWRAIKLLRFCRKALCHSCSSHFLVL